MAIPKVGVDNELIETDFNTKAVNAALKENPRLVNYYKKLILIKFLQVITSNKSPMDKCSEINRLISEMYFIPFELSNWISSVENGLKTSSTGVVKAFIQHASKICFSAENLNFNELDLEEERIKAERKFFNFLYREIFTQNEQISSNFSES